MLSGIQTIVMISNVEFYGPLNRKIASHRNNTVSVKYKMNFVTHLIETHVT